MKSLSILFAIIFCLPVLAQDRFSKVEIKHQKLSDHVYMIEGAGGNMALVEGPKVLYLIDDQFAPLTERILAHIKTISAKPIKYVLNTHFHGDHTGGNQNMAAEGAIIVAHDNVRSRMATKQFNVVGRELPPSPYEALPHMTFSDQIEIHIDSTASLQMFHVHSGHTDGDAMVFFPTENVLHMGDILFNGFYPIIHVAGGGSVDGIIAAVNKAIFLVNEETKIIPGHGELATRDDLLFYRDMLMTIRSRVYKAMKDGKTLEQIQEMNPTKEWDETHGKWFVKPEFLVKSMFESLDVGKK